ncbi:MAG: NRDE family protein [Pseudomonadota bacterium]
MCLILFSLQPDRPIPLVVAANRDEFYARPADGAHAWTDEPTIFAGRDREAGGTWLGVSTSGRFAAVTNFSAGDPPRNYPQSRGELVAGFLRGDASARAYADGLRGDDYAGFNLLVFDGQEMVYTNNKGYPTERLEPGHYGLSNAELRAGWPKADEGAQALAAADPATASNRALLDILGDDVPPPDERIPSRPHLAQAPLEDRRLHAARFIATGEYGTRAMTIVRMGPETIDVLEQQIGPHGVRGDAVMARVPRSH